MTTTGALRLLGPDDVDAVVDLATLCEIAETGHPDPEVVDWLRAGTSNDVVRLFGVDDDAGLAAFASVECRGGHTGLAAEVRVRPGLDLDLGAAPLRAVRRAAAEHDPRKPLHLFTNRDAMPQRRWLEAQGAAVVRHFWRMAIDLPEEAPPRPMRPAGVTVRQARDDETDLRTVFDIVESSFAEHFGQGDDGDYDGWIEQWRARTAFDLTLWWVAEIDSTPVAVLLGGTLGGEGVVSTLGTLKSARGRGIGAFLLRTSFAEMHARGRRRVTLGVDSDNATGAVRLYESVGMHVAADWALYELPPLAPTRQGPAGSTRSASNAV